MTLTSVVLLVASVVAVWWLLGAGIMWRRKTRAHFEVAIRGLLIALEDGGTLRVRQNRGDARFEFVRTDGAGDQASVILNVPVSAWSTRHEAGIREVLAVNGFVLRESPRIDQRILASVIIQVEDIWVTWSGAKCVRVAHLLLDAGGVPQTATFQFVLDGPRSRRLLDRRRSSDT